MRDHTEKLFDEIIEELPPDDGMRPEWPAPEFPDPDDDDDWWPVTDRIRSYDPSDQGDALGLSGDALGLSDEVYGSALRRHGPDALAFYKSRRFVAKTPHPGMWGIFYLSEGLATVARDLSQFDPGCKNPRDLAYKFLREHEIYHFRADIQTLLFESTLKKHLYLPLRRALRGQKSHFVEEALANEHAYRWAARHKPNKLGAFAVNFMNCQPNAYARFGEPLLELAGEWAANVVDQNPPGCSPRRDLAHWVNSTPSKFQPYSAVPEYEIWQTHGGSVFPSVWAFPPIYQIDEAPIAATLHRSPQIAAKWQATKQKLFNDRFGNGLDFKPWPNGGPHVYAARVDLNNRVHLQHRGQGDWVATKLGSHSKLGHG